MTPAIQLLQRQKVPHQVHEYEHDPAAPSYGLEAAEKMGVPPAEVFKTLVAQIDGRQLVVAVLPVDQQLSLKKLAKAAGAKKAVMADPQQVARSSGYVLGGVSPLGQKKRLPTFIDVSAESLAQMHVSGGRRGLEIALAPQALCALTAGQWADLTDTA